MTAALLDRRSAHHETDGCGWFSGNLADDIPTQFIPRVPDSPLRHRWAEPTPGLLTRLLGGLTRL